jgi:ligand-binding sensor domain-containing protein/putative methionine-R-sulfoxide reductase with GAF domain
MPATAKQLFLALALFAFLNGEGQKKIYQQQEHVFTTYTAADGLASAEIISVAVDDKGFLWVGTVAGLSRYDGYTFTNYSWSADNHFIGIVNVIKAGTESELWIGTSSGLYCWWQNKLVKISEESKSPQGVNDIIAGADGNLWLATETGPAYITAAAIDISGTKKILLQKFILQQWAEKYDAIYPSQCRLIKNAPDGTVYFSNQYQLFKITSGTIELLHTARQENDKIDFIIPVNNTKVFFNAAMTGLNKVQGGRYSNLDFENLYQPSRKPEREGVWYVGSLGIVCFHPDEEFISESILFKEKGASWLSFILKQNTIFWLATHNGLIKIKPSAFNLYTADAFSRIDETFSFCELKDGRFLTGANHGEVYEVGEKGVTRFFPRGIKPVPNAEIKAMYQDQRGWLWMGTGYQGIALYRNGKTKRFTEEANHLHDNSFSSFLATKNGRLFAIGDKGMSEIMVDENGGISFKPFFSRPVYTAYSKFYGGMEAPDGTVWIGGEEGLRFLRGDSLVTYLLPVRNLSVQGIKIAADGLVWIATGGNGIICCRFDRYNKLQVVKQYDKASGLNTLHFLDLFIDKDDNIWAGSVKGLTIIGRNGKHIGAVLNFDEADGFIAPGYYSSKIYQNKQGEIWMGTPKGIASFMPGDLIFSSQEPALYLTGVDFLKRRSISANSDSIIALNHQEELNLSYNNNSLSFSYVAIGLEAPEGLQYYYRISTLDTNWIDGGYNRTASYYNLPAGKYVFEVKAVNDKGLWSKEIKFFFSIAPPFWQTWWFRLLLLALILLVIYMYIRRQAKNIAKREAYKMEVEKLKLVNLQSQLETEQVVSYFAASIGNQSTIDNLLWDVAKNLIGKLGFEDCMIYLWNNDKTVLLQKAGYGAKGSMQSEIDKDKYNVKKNIGIVGATVERMQAILVNDTSTDERYFSVDDKIRLSELCVPIIHHNEAMGAINTEHTEKGFYTRRHLQILTTIASILADKIDMLEAEQHAREKEIDVLKLSKDLSDWQVAALRAQMNPHFIFNAMNSIQQFTLKNDVDNANLYLSKFSTLLRKVLHSSQQNFITLEEEMEQLKLYLDIEKLRLDGEFTYRVNAGEDIETDAIKIPGMLIQPFIENALKHGLAIKEGEKVLTIEFTLVSEHLLKCIITDNGIGRRKAMEFKQQQEKLLPYESKGIRLVEERLALLNKEKQHNLPVFEDLYDESGHPMGTSVSLEVPVLLPGL